MARVYMYIPAGFLQVSARDNGKVNFVSSNKRRATLKADFDQ